MCIEWEHHRLRLCQGVARCGAVQRQRGSLFTFLSEFSYFNVSATLLSHNPETLWRSSAVIISGVEFVEVADA